MSTGKTSSVPAPERSAFTLLELLVCLLVVAILFSLSFSGIRSARLKAWDLSCQERCRSIGTLVTAYSLDFRSAYPVWVGPPPDSEVISSWSSSYTLQGFRLFSSARWLRYAGATALDPKYRCPANQRLRSGEEVAADYVGVSAMYAESGFLDPTLSKRSWAARLGAMPQTLDAVVFPSAKVGVFEESIWHSWTGIYAIGSNVTGLSFFDSLRPANAWFFDGHVDGISYGRALPAVERDPTWWSAKVVLTEYGVRGRDR